MNSYSASSGLLLILLSFLMFTTSCDKSEIRVDQLKVNFVTNIDNTPLLSWQTESEHEGFIQSASQILISDGEDKLKKDEGNIWDSGKTLSSEQMNIKAGGEFKSGNQYFIKVRVWDANDSPSSWSETRDFFIPLEYPEDWHSQWISYDYHPDAALPVFTKVFKKSPERAIDFARLYISAPGFYEAFLNGEKIGNNVLDPGQTNYEDYTFYTAYEIDKDWLKEDNTLAVMLGNGWYNQNEVWKGQEEYSAMVYGQPVFICQLIIRYENGEEEIIGSDESWKWKNGPITYSNIYGGETHDANLEVDMVSGNYESDPSWKKALPAVIHPVELYEQYADPIRKMGTVEVSRIIDNGDGKYIFDMGENYAGWVKLSIDGEKGQEITIRFAEELDSSLNIDPATTGVRATTVVQTSKYICKGEGTEVWEPRFTYHGFRYAEVSGLKEKPAKELLEGIRVYSSVPDAGQFTSSEENLNKLHELATRTIISNIHSIPTDCPHRERCGWTGDAHALVQSLFFNYDAQRFMIKYMFDMRSSAREEKVELYFGKDFHDRSMVTKPEGIPTMIVPGKRTSGIASPDWGTAMVQLPWYLYVYYGDVQILNEFYQDMKTWVQYIHDKNEDGIILHGLGDWCPPYDWDDRCPVPQSSTAFHILDVKIMKEVAGILGYEKDHTYYSEILEKLIQSFNREFLDTKNNTYGTQTGNAMALEIGIVPEEFQEKVAASIVKYSHEKHYGFLNTGIFGIGRIFKVLCENGQEQEAYRLLTKTGEHSFAFMWEQWDATTLWETLPVSMPLNDRMRGAYYNSSHSHPMQAGYDAWFYSGIAGINPDPEEPGFKKIVFRPYLTRQMESAKATYHSGFGEILSSWYQQDGNLNWEIGIPANCSGEIFVPNYGEKVSVSINSKPVEVSDFSNDFTSIGVFNAGKYIVSVGPFN